MTTMLYQGHGSYRITANDGTIIYVDPSLGEGYDQPADLILVTHEHIDHNRVDLMPHAAGCEIFRAKDFQPEPEEYATITSHGIRMTGVEACNENHPVEECVGIIIEVDGVSFYAAGDTSTTTDMRYGILQVLKLDYATFPLDGYYNMGPQEATECARLVAAKHSIPLHMVPVHDINDATLFDQAVADAFDGPGKIVMKPGQSLDLVHQ